MSYFRPALIVSAFVACSLMIGHSALTLVLGAGNEKMLRNQSVFTDYRGQRPGTFHKITPADLPRPYATPSVDNGPELVPRPAGAWRSEEHTSELQSRPHLLCRLLLEK